MSGRAVQLATPIAIFEFWENDRFERVDALPQAQDHVPVRNPRRFVDLAMRRGVSALLLSVPMAVIPEFNTNWQNC